MNKMVSSGLICLKNDFNIEFVLCKIDYVLYENEHFKYVFTPYYDVIDLLEPDLFQGIPGIDIDLRKKEYVRENIIPTFISERVPSENREDYFELLESVGLSYMDSIKYLIKSKLVYSGDKLYLKEYKEKEKVILEDCIGKANSLGIIKIILDNIASSNIVIMKNGDILNKKEIFDALLFIYKKGFETNYKKQLSGIDLSKEKGKYKGRKSIHVDELAFAKELEKVEKGMISPKEAASNLKISIDKYYRFKKQITKLK